MIQPRTVEFFFGFFVYPDFTSMFEFNRKFINLKINVVKLQLFFYFQQVNVRVCFRPIIDRLQLPQS